MFKIFITSCKSTSVIEMDGLEQSSRVFFNEPICKLFVLDVFTVMYFH